MKVNLWGMGVQVPVLQIQIASVCANNNGTGSGVGCPMDWVCLNGVLRGCMGHV